VKLDPEREADQILATADTRMRQAFSFDVRRFGQPVVLSEIVTVLQGTSGVVAVDIDSFMRVPSDSTMDPVRERLIAQTPSPREAAPLPAELLLLSERRIDFAIMS
jgi:hypothetical protein